MYCRSQRSSIGDEIKELGLTGSPLCDKIEKLPVSPLCDKNLNTTAPENAPITIKFKSSSTQTDSEKFSLPTKLILMASLGFVVFGLFVFTFFGAIELETSTLYPITWFPNLPNPAVSIRFVPVRDPLVW